jgi:hypothetical protein
MNRFRNHLLAFALLLPATYANATVIGTFTDKASFSATVGTTSTETFNSFTSDTPFHTVPLDIGDFTLSMIGMPATHANQIDSPPQRWSGTDIDGTARLDVYTQGGSSLIFTFDEGITAFGADFKSFNDTYLRTQIFVDGTLLNPPVSPNNYRLTFFGFETDTLFSTVEFRGNISDGYGIDNVQYASAAVPEPSTFFLFGTGLLGLGLNRKRKNKA